MAKLYAELTGHKSARVSSKSDDTRLVVKAYHKNILLGSFEMYQVHDNDTVNVLWRPHGKGFGSETHLIQNSQPK